MNKRKNSMMSKTLTQLNNDYNSDRSHISDWKLDSDDTETLIKNYENEE